MLTTFDIGPLPNTPLQNVFPYRKKESGSIRILAKSDLGPAYSYPARQLDSEWWQPIPNLVPLQGNTI